jgi:hypothetical protein
VCVCVYIHIHIYVYVCVYVYIYTYIHTHTHIKKGKGVPLQAWSGPEGSRKLRFPDYMTTQDGGKAAFTPRKCSWYSFLLEA